MARNEKAEFAVKILLEYAGENQVPARSTSDLSPLEQWLILRLYNGGEFFIDFAIWVQDNYSQNKYANTNEMLPKGQMRKDFTNDIYTMAEIWQHYNSP